MIVFNKNRAKDNSNKKFFLFVYIFLFFAGIYSGMYCLRFGVLADLSQHYKSLTQDPANYLEHTFKQEKDDLPLMKLDFKFKDYMLLSNQRSRFVYSSRHFFKGQQWFDRKDAYVKLDIKYKGQKYRAKAKLFGLNNDHFRHPYKWSFRIKSKDYIPDFQNLKFNLLQPNTRQYLSDILCNKVFSAYHILDLKYTPVSVKINDRTKDIYYVEDFFSKNLIERNSLRDSYIFSFNKIKHPSLDKMTNQQKASFNLLKEDVILDRNDIIDTAKFDVFMATIFILQNKHPILEGNFHMFYNAVTNKVEPLVRETWFESELKITSAIDMKEQLLEFVKKMKSYNKSLHRYLDGIIEHDSRLLDVYEKVIAVANTMHNIVQADNWRSLEERIYARYPNALFICRNLRKNIKAVVDLKITSRRLDVRESTPFLIQKDTVLNKDLTLKNRDLTISPGVTVDLNGHNIIIEEGRLHAVSTPKKSITLLNRSRNNASIFVKQAKDTSYLVNVAVKNLSNFKEKYWNLPASLTFYESNVKMVNSTFTSNMSGDDYVNFFRCSYFHVDNVVFNEVLADAIDSDFSRGVISNSTFIGVGNDAIDGSGSTIDIKECKFKDIKDKVISAGENSYFTVSDSSIESSEIVFVSKDGATVKERNNILINNRLDYCTFRKKKEFGFGKLYSDKEIKNYSYLVEKRSVIYKNNRLLTNLIQKDSVKEKLYGVEYGKKSIR